MYIGQTKYPLYHRINGHVADSKRNTTKLSNAIRKYGREYFVIEPIVEGDFNQAFSDHLETHYIRLYATQFQYNIKEGGNSVKMSDETKRKISEANKGTKMPKRINYKDSDRYSTEQFNEIKKKRSESHFGGKNTKAKKVLNTKTGIIYNCIKDAAFSSNINVITLRRKLRGVYKNNTTFTLV